METTIQGLGLLAKRPDFASIAWGLGGLLLGEGSITRQIFLMIPGIHVLSGSPEALSQTPTPYPTKTEPF